MMLKIKKYRRTLAGLGFFSVLLIAGLSLMELYLELSGVLFMLTAIAALLYAPLIWLFKKIKNGRWLQFWLQREVFIVCVVLGFLCLIGAIDSMNDYIILTILFVEFLLIIIVFAMLRFFKRSPQYMDHPVHQWKMPKWSYLVFFIGNGMLILLFEDYYSNNEPFAIAILFYLMAFFLWLMNWFLKQILSIIRLRNERSTAELRHLQSQVNPHFFFNMLNNLYGWVAKDTKKAQEMILKLSDMMRYSIYDGQKEVVTLVEEIDYLNNYIELHQMRYHKKIAVSFTTDIQQADYHIMPLLFIILLENAFKHGVENLRENAYINMNLSAKNQVIIFSIENNFDPEQVKPETGIGLKNLKRRLALAYPKKHEFLCFQTDDIYQAKLTIKV